MEKIGIYSAVQDKRSDQNENNYYRRSGGAQQPLQETRRNDKTAEIKIFEADQDISYSGCALPYYISNKITDRAEVVPRNAAFFKQKYNVDKWTRAIGYWR